MLRNLDDALGKNILHDVFQLRGLAQTEAEVPPGNAKRIDVWFVPDEQKRALAPQFTGILAQLAAEPAAIELWSDPLGEGDFHTSMTKRGLWRETLELREKRPWKVPMLWHICAGKPETVLLQFGYETAEFTGLYRPSGPGWRVQIVVLAEIPKTRGTLLLRLLGRGKVRRDALREIRALPDDAWEKQLASTWLVRLGLVVPMETAMTSEDLEFYADARAWYEEHNRKLRDEVLREAEVQFQARLAEERRLFEAQRAEEYRKLEAQRAEEYRKLEAQRAEEKRKLEAQRAETQRQAEINQLVHLFEHRLGQRLVTEERARLIARVDTLGSVHVADLVLDLSVTELAVWLKQDDPQRGD